ncbi:extensin [Streptomyces sp. NPDC050738]|uniref:extensin n=1 Tax=Streptomyces sp. NPDC050738 TaxID=3154744 RepID=UPI00343C01FE
MPHTPAQAEVQRLLRTLTIVLCTVAVLALVFTAVNITLFARTRGIPLPIAILLDPMLSLALAAVLYADARLASWGVRPPAWSTTLRWSAGCTAAAMNSWQSLWPDGQIGWPDRADPAAVLLHLVPPLLLIALTETIAAYRRTVAVLLETIGSTDRTAPSPTATTIAETAGPCTDPGAAPANPTAERHLEASPGPATASPDLVHARPPPARPAHPPQPPPPSGGAGNADVWARAVALDATARASRGRPVSVWRLRTDLRIGPDRATQIRDQLLAHHPNQPTTALVTSTDPTE